MTKAIEALRKVADECQQRAKDASDRSLKAELFDLTTKWHLLAGQAAELCGKTEDLEVIERAVVNIR
jgi:hypothetical protein